MASKPSKERITEIWNKIRMSEKFLEEELEPIMQESLKRYMGTFIPSIGAGWDLALNEVYPIIQHSLPAIFFRNPRAFLKPRNKTFIKKQRDPVSGRMIEVQADSSESARTQEAILNYLITQIGYKEEVRRTLLDALLFPYGIMCS